MRKAVRAGFLLSLALVAGTWAISALGDGMRAFSPWLAPLLVPALLLVLPVLFAFRVSWRSASHDGVAFITCAIPAAISGLLGYGGDICTKLFWDHGHTLLNLVGYVDPFDISHRVVSLVPMAVWAGSTALLGVLLKRAVRGERTAGESKES